MGTTASADVQGMASWILAGMHGRMAHHILGWPLTASPVSVELVPIVSNGRLPEYEVMPQVAPPSAWPSPASP